MWKRFKEHAKYSRAWHNAAMIVHALYVIVLLAGPFCIKEWIAFTPWRGIGFTVFMILNIVAASWLQTSLQIWEIFVQVRERQQSETKSSLP